MMMKTFTAVLIVSALARVAAADDGPPGLQPDPQKDRTTAFELSIGGTAASLAVVGLGASSQSGGVELAGLASLLVTPSLGEWYAGQPFTLGMGVRAASTAAFIVGISTAIRCDGEQSSGCGLGALWVAGAIGYGAGILIDVAGAGHAVDRFNAAHRLQFAPTVMATPSGSVMGMGVGGRF
ncbi:MAG TPA: hypothetical protein VMJ10_34895 [Kofleriaceae bacterium]|nr:hypothetical protein [Kofleriaceae bacterium]